ncbi:MAG: phosphoheptose isomerase [Treponema sp. CETP13]|nr:MAG: phosphoheptose isomerase [Treponema sp. CETP13]
MFKTIPYISEKVWGYERWIISTHKAGQSLIDGTTQFIGGKKINKVVGENYPLLIKIIQTNDNLSVQVHPDDEYAKRVENTSGKTECWYILDAEPGATLICGLNKKYTQEELRIAIKDNKLESCLRYIPVSKGDLVFIPAGTVHAIQGGIRLIEIQEPSDITYRLYDWGRKRKTHIEKALDVIKNNTPDSVKDFTGPFDCKYFKLDKIDITSEVKINFDEAVKDKEGNVKETPAGKTGWVSFFVISGTADLESSSGEKINVKAEDTLMVRVDEILTVKNVNDFSILKIL